MAAHPAGSTALTLLLTLAAPATAFAAEPATPARFSTPTLDRVALLKTLRETPHARFDGVWSASIQQQADSALSNDAPADLSPSPAFGEKGSWRWALYGGAAADLRRDGEQYNATWAASYFLADNFSVDYEFGAYYFAQGQDADDAGGGNFNVLFRWHFLAEERWSLYIDGGAGLLLSTDDVPPDGTSFNFTPQAGLGFTHDLGDDGARLHAGMRWHHISNGRTSGSDDNPGRDAIMAYAGVSFPWGR